MRSVRFSGWGGPVATPRAPFIHDEWWLGIEPDPRFLPLIDCNLERRADYRSQVVPYLRARGADDDQMIELLVRIDLENLAHAFTILFCSDHELVLRSVMPEHLYRVIEGVQPVIDHVGRELFGPVDFYLELLRELAPRCGLHHRAQPPGPTTTGAGDIVFQSVQVVEALRQFDPDLGGVTIAKTYFADQTMAADHCLELFQPALRDGGSPQCHRHTVERLTNLHIESVGSAGLSLQPPICHLSIEAPDVATVHAIHDVVANDTSGMLMPYVDRVTLNPGDHSTNTKLSIRSHPDSPVYNKIIEVVHLET
jgi:hypothetical protein